MKNRHINTLRELSKFAAGLIAADFFTGAWLYFSDMLPMDFLGLSISPEGAIFWMIFDVLIFLLLVHYAWHTVIPSPSIHQKNFYKLVGTLLGIVAILHLLRLIFGVEIQIGSWSAPLWLSWIGTIVTGYLSYASFKFACQKH